MKKQFVLDWNYFSRASNQLIVFISIIDENKRKWLILFPVSMHLFHGVQSHIELSEEKSKNPIFCQRISVMKTNTAAVFCFQDKA